MVAQRGLKTRRRERRERHLASLREALVAHGYRENVHDADVSRVDLLVTEGTRTLAIVLRDAPDAREDHLRSRLAEALLTASAACALTENDWIPVGIVAAPHVTGVMSSVIEGHVPGLAEGLRHEQVGWGVVDDGGLVRVHVPGIDVTRGQETELRPEQPAVFDPFTDRGQWLLKVLLAALIPEKYIVGVDREQHSTPMTQQIVPRTAYQLGPKAGVSTATADRVTRWLKSEGFLDDADSALRPRRVPDLMARWRGRYPGPSAFIPAAWHVPTRDSLGALRAALVRFAGRRASAGFATAPPASGGGLQAKQPRACLASFTACDALGVGIVKGMPLRIYLEQPEQALDALGLRRAAAGQPPDVLVLKPSHPESIFRAHVVRDRVAAADAIQCWLDMAHERARGEEQAHALEGGALGPLFRPDAS